MSRRFILPLLLLVVFAVVLPASAEEGAERRLALREAQEPLRARDWEAAATGLAAFRARFPGTAEATEAWVLESRALLRAGRAREALDATTAFLEAHGESAWVGRMKHNAADAYAALSQPKAAADVLRERVDSATAPEARAAIGMLHVKLADGDFEGVEVTDDLGRTTKQPNMGRALQAYRHALAIGVPDAEQPRVRERIALALERLNKAFEAVAMWNALLTDAEAGTIEADADARYRWLIGRGRARLRAGRFDEAQKDLRQALEAGVKGPRQMEVLLLLAEERLGAAGRGAGEVAFEEGVAWLRRAVLEHKTDDRAPKAQKTLAEAYEARGLAEQAAAEWEALVERFPGADEAPHARDRQAQALQKAGRFDDAIAAWERFLAAWPNHRLWQPVRDRIVTAAFAKGDALSAQDDAPGAIAAWQAFAAAYPTDPRAAQALVKAGSAMREREDVTAALALWRQVAGRYAGTSQAPHALLLVAQTLEDDLADLEAAVKAYEDLLGRFPKGAPANEARARLERLKAHHLELMLEKVVPTSQRAAIRVRTRNVESLDVRVYRLEIEEYFRRKGTVLGVENLQLEVVKPDQTATWKLDDYKPFALFEADRVVPVDKPGAYVVVAGDDLLTATALFLVSDVEMVVKKARHTHLFVWAFARADQAPVEGARVLVNENGKVREVGTTGADGVWQGSTGVAASNVLVLSDQGPAATGVASGPSVASGFQSKAYVYTDAPVYRPGHEVRWRAIFLDAAGGSYQAPRERKGRVTVKDARGQTLLDDDLTSSAFGTFAGAFDLDGAAPLGVWEVQLTVRHEGSWTGKFEVQEFKKPEFTMEVAPARPLYLTGETVEATARLTYAFGGPVAQAPVNWEVHRVSQVFAPSATDDYRWYFQDDRDPAETRRAGPSQGVLVARGTSSTDDAGEVVISFEAEERDDDSMYVVRVGAQDVTRRWVMDEGRIPVTRRDHMAVVKADRKVYRPKQQVVVEIRTVDALERAVARSGELQVIAVENVRLVPGVDLAPTPPAPRRGGRRPAVVSEVERTVATYPLTTDADGSAELRFEMPGPGRWRLRWRALDGRGAVVTATTAVEAAGEAEDESRDARLVAARRVWTEGDEAEVLLRSPVTGVKALLTYEGERVLDYRFVDIRGRSTLLALPVTGAHAPNVFFQVAIPGEGRLLEAGAEIVVLRYLQVEVEIPATSKPGQEVEAIVRTKDARGNPVAAEVGFGLVDETLYAIAADRAPSIRPFFYDRRRQKAVITATSLGFQAPGTTRETNQDLLADEAARTGDMRLAMARSALRNAEEAMRRGDARTAATLALRAAESAPDLYEARVLLASLREDRQVRKELAKMDAVLLEELQRTAAMEPPRAPAPRASAKSKDARFYDREESESMDDALSDAPFEGPSQNGLIGLGGGAGGAFGGRGGRRSLSAGGGGRARNRAAQAQADQLGAVFKQLEQSAGFADKKALAKGLFGLDAGFDAEIRQHFADVAGWEAHLVTGADGMARTTLKLPDNLTTWRAVVRGVSAQALVGEGRARLHARRDLVVRIDAPRFLVQGDRATLPIAVHNESGKPLTVTEGITLEGVQTLGVVRSDRDVDLSSGQPSYTLPAGAHGVTDVDTRAVDPGSVRVKAEARSAEGAFDRLEIGFGSLPKGIRVVEGRTGVADATRGALQETFLDVPDGAIAEATALAVVLYPGLDAALLDALLYLDVFPYGCVEQTVHRFLPALQARAALIAAASPAAKKLADLDEAVRRAAVRLSNLQNGDGSYGWFRRGQGNLAMTAYALLGLTGARSAGVPDLDHAIQNAGNALERLVQAGDENVRALGHYALASAGRMNQEAYATTFRRRRDDLAVPGLAWMALAAHQLDRSYDADELAGLILERRIEDGTTTHWAGAKDDCFVGSAREATGLAIQALLVGGRDTPHAERGLTWLLANRSEGSFGTTKATAAFVGAASAWVQGHGAQGFGGSLEVLLDGDVVRTINVGPQGLAAKDRRFLLPQTTSWNPGRHTLGFRLAGQGRLHWAARLSSVVASEDLPADPHGMDIVRTYVRPEEVGVEGQPAPVKPGYEVLRPAARPRVEARPLTVVNAGDRVLVRVEIDAPRDLEYVLIEDPLPAGFDVLDATWEGPFDWQERRDDRQVFFCSKLPKGKTVFRYVLQATHWGSFTALGTTAVAMYLPQVHARGAGSQIGVAKQPLQGTDAEHPPTPDELWAAAKAFVKERAYDKAVPMLASLRDDQPLRDDVIEEIESILLKIAVERDDAKEIVRAREALVRRNPARIPSDWRTQRRIAFAYHTLGEVETASALYRDLVARGFGLQVDWARTLTARKRELEGLDSLGTALKVFPISNATADADFRRSQRYRELPRPEGREGPTGRPMDAETLDALWAFTAHYAETHLADPANYALVGAQRRAGDDEGAASSAEAFLARFPKSRFVDDAYYFLAESRYRTFERDPNETRAAPVREAAMPLVDKKFANDAGQSVWSEYRARGFALLARVAHVLGDLDQAIAYYYQARSLEDAREAHAFLTEQRLDLDPTLTVPLAGGVDLPVRYRNVKSAVFKAYPVDLQVLFAVRKSLEGLHDVDLSGIVPQHEWTHEFASAADHLGHEGTVSLPVETGAAGAWLVVVKAGDHEAKTLAVKTDLKVVLQRIGEKVRVYVTDGEGQNVREAYVTIADGDRIRARGLTDGRGVFEAPGVGGRVAVVVSKGDRYAIAR